MSLVYFERRWARSWNVHLSGGRVASVRVRRSPFWLAYGRCSRELARNWMLEREVLRRAEIEAMRKMGIRRDEEALLTRS